MPKKFLTVKEVAQLLGVTPLTVRNWDSKGKLTAHRHPMNNYRLYRTEDVENLIRELEISKVAHKIPNIPIPQTPREPEKPKIRKLEIEVL
jgi:MerR family transcriptional regulator, copper efflux regulator